MGGSTRPCSVVWLDNAGSEAARKLSITAYWQSQAWQDASRHQMQQRSILLAVMVRVALEISGHMSRENPAQHYCRHDAA